MTILGFFEVFWGDTDEYCEGLLPGSIRSLSGTYEFFGKPLIVIEDGYQNGMPPVHFLWEMPRIPDPDDPIQASCAKQLFISQCLLAMDWIDEIRTFRDKCN